MFSGASGGEGLPEISLDEDISGEEVILDGGSD